MTYNRTNDTIPFPPNSVASLSTNEIVWYSIIGVFNVIIGGIVCGAICMALTPKCFKRRVISCYKRMKQPCRCFTSEQTIEEQTGVQAHSTEVPSRNYEVISLYMDECYTNEHTNEDNSSIEQDLNQESDQSSTIQSNNDDNDIAGEPPPYSSVVSKPQEDPDCPPTYEEVTANPADFKL